MRVHQRDLNHTCEWDGCEEDQFEDWYYCEQHAQKLELMNDFFRPLVR